MSQAFDVTKPATGVTTFGALYALLRANFEALNTCHSGTTEPASPVNGQYFFNTTTGKLSVYNSGWKEVLVEDYGMAAEVEAARGSHASLDARLDAQINEDGTLKAATTLNPSQWYDLSVASGWISTTSFRALGADYTTVYYPTRRLKINQTGGTYYTEVVSSSYSAPNTTVITKDAVCGASAAVFRDVSHSIFGPRPDGAGDGAMSIEMLMNPTWTDYSSSSTIVGWAASPTSGIFYWRLGGIVFCHVYITGTSNATTISFTLPFAVKSTTYYEPKFPVSGTDNGTALTTPASARLSSGSNVVTVVKDYAATAWTNSGTKAIHCDFFYHC